MNVLDEALGVAEVVGVPGCAQEVVDAAHAHRRDVTVELGEPGSRLGEVAVGTFSADTELLAEQFDLDFVVTFGRAD